MGHESANCGRIQGDPGGAGTPEPGSDPTPNCEADLSISMPNRDPQQLREHARRLLDTSRHEYDTARYNRLRSMRIGIDSGLSTHEVGEVLGITGSGVRKALKRAGDA